MSDAIKIETYVTALARALRSLPDRDRDDITAEIRAHLDHRAGEGRLTEALAALGSPEICARSFMDEIRIQAAFADGGPSKTFGALLALASRRVTAGVGLFVALTFFLLAAGFAFTGLAEFVAPDKAGLWVGHNTLVFGTIDPPAAPQAPDAPAPPREVLGRWLIPVAAGLAVLFFIVGQWLSRLFIRMMMKKKSPTAI